MPRPIYALIRPSALAHNVSVARQHAPHSFLWGVIKANAYGHGIERVLPALSQVDGLAMLDFAEADLVRRLGWTKPILMLEGSFDHADLLQTQEQDLCLVLHSTEQLSQLERMRLPVKVYVKLNSGMNRLGFQQHDLETLLPRLCAATHVQVLSWMTHFSSADVTTGIDGAYQRFLQMMTQVHAQCPNQTNAQSVSNSAAIVLHPKVHAQAVRAGIMLYGASPVSAQSALQLQLQPTMCLHSELIAIQYLLPGDTVGYGGMFTAEHSMTIGIVACGYADGYPRHAPSGTPICVDGIKTTLVGRVSMDMLAVDLSPVTHAKVGSKVELWGDTLPIDEVAHSAGTIAYELMCALAQRVPVRIA